jgi:hypothetical protein
VSSQVVYQTNADYYASEEAIAQNNLIIFEKTKKGLLWFRFTSSRTIFQLSPNGKLQVKWSNLEEKKLLYKLVKSLLIANKNEELAIKPLKQQTWIDYPEPESFKVYWCDQSTEFVNKKYTEQPTSQNRNAIWGYTQGGRYCIKGATLEEINKRKQLEEIKIDIKDIIEKNNKAMEEMRNYRAMNFAELIWEYSKDCYSIVELEQRTKEAINVAICIRYFNKAEKLPETLKVYYRTLKHTTKNSIPAAKMILQLYPELVGTITVSGVEWKDETKDRWERIFHWNPSFDYINN